MIALVDGTGLLRLLVALLWRSIRGPRQPS
jgi:hypothetical protein